jgi:hypothetical protein
LQVSDFTGLQPNDFLFIDSTHTVKAGGDCVYIYLKMLPAMPPGVLIHCHDIFLPAPMPIAWLTDLSLYWCEQYLLQAYLLDRPNINVLFGSHYHNLINLEDLINLMGGKRGEGGSSFWFRKTAA